MSSPEGIPLHELLAAEERTQTEQARILLVRLFTNAVKPLDQIVILVDENSAPNQTVIDINE